MVAFKAARSLTVVSLVVAGTVAIVPRVAAVPRSSISPYIYLNRCVGGCVVHGTGGGASDARTQTSPIPAVGTYTISEFANQFGQTGTAGTCVAGANANLTCTDDTGCPGGSCDTADREWAKIVQCVKEVYSPFAVTLTDQITQIPAGSSYTEMIIAGQASDLGLASSVFGIAPITGDCNAQDNAISFSFANNHGTQNRVNDICSTAVRETARVFGLEDEYQFVDAYPSNQKSTCMDPMTTRIDCGGEKFFRNAAATCGIGSPQACRCGGTQSSHQRLVSLFGAATSIVPPPTASILSPTAGTLVGSNTAVHVEAGSRRGVNRVELWLNGYKWTSAPGLAFGPEGQPNPASYALAIPAGVPDSIIDIVVKVYDDLEIETDSATVTVTKGSACTTAATCLTGQQCADGKCYWDSPIGELGEPCAYDQFCKSNDCSSTSSGQLCTQQCTVGASDACPAGFDCLDQNASGICMRSGQAGGCCNVGGGDARTSFALAMLVLSLVLRRRRR